jgi:hypothetical protein
MHHGHNGCLNSCDVNSQIQGAHYQEGIAMSEEHLLASYLVKGGYFARAQKPIGPSLKHGLLGKKKACLLRDLSVEAYYPDFVSRSDHGRKEY